MDYTYEKALVYLREKTTPKYVFYCLEGGHDYLINAAIEVAAATGDYKKAAELNEEGRAHVQ